MINAKINENKKKWSQKCLSLQNAWIKNWQITVNSTVMGIVLCFITTNKTAHFCYYLKSQNITRQQ